MVLFCPMQASLVSALGALSQPRVPPLVFFHFSAARPDQRLALSLLRRLCTYLHRKLREPSALPGTYRWAGTPKISQRPCPPCASSTSDPDLVTHRGLVWELQQRLLPKSAQSLRPGQTLVLIVDGADKLVGQNGQLTSDWIPKSLPRVSVRPG